MRRKPAKSTLADAIASALGGRSVYRYPPRGAVAHGIALACLLPHSAAALSLGELDVRTALGEPLTATVAATLRPGESLAPNCISSVASDTGSLSLPAALSISVPETSAPGRHTIRLSSRQPLYEPMYEIRLQVKCPGSVALVRDYIVMLNLPMAPALQAPKPAPAPVAAPQASRPNRVAPARPSARRPVSVAPVSADPRPYTERFPTPTARIPGTEYRVQSGDTLSTIAQRVPDRGSLTLWEYADAIFQANPDAFVANDPNRIKLGATITLPGTPLVSPQSASIAPEKTAAPQATLIEASVTSPYSANETTDDGTTLIETTIEYRAEEPEPMLVGESGAAVASPQPATVPIQRLERLTSPPQASAPAEAPAVNEATTGSNPFNWNVGLAVGLLIGGLLVLFLAGAKRLSRRRRETLAAAPVAQVAERDDAPLAETDSDETPVTHVDFVESPAPSALPRISLRDEANSPSPEKDTIDRLIELDEPAAEADHAWLEESVEDTLAGELPVENTARFSTPAFAPSDAGDDRGPSELEGTSTLRKLFGEDEPANEPADLQSLAHSVHSGSADDTLSQTLSDALSLLEQDYENEMTDSQILEQHNLRDAF